MSDTDEGLRRVHRAHTATDAIHACLYFQPEAEQEYVAAGLRPGRMGYFASRSAPMGAVAPAVVAASFYNFNPELVARFIPRAWTLVSPADVVSARFRAARTVLTRLLADVDPAEIDELTGLLRRAAEQADPAGRPLFAAHAALPWPDEPLTALWHGVTLLREHRGDGHLAVLLNHDLNGIDALVSHVAGGRSFTVDAAKLLRGWNDEQWDEAASRLQRRGVLDDRGGLTDDGRELRSQIELDTDRLARAPWDGLGADPTSRVVELGKRVGEPCRASLPADMFARR